MFEAWHPRNVKTGKGKRGTVTRKCNKGFLQERRNVTRGVGGGVTMKMDTCALLHFLFYCFVCQWSPFKNQCY